MTEPIFLQGICKDYLWGGNRLREEFGKESDADKIAESWELACHKDGSSILTSGSDAGLNLREYLDKNGTAFLGTNCADCTTVPVLIKLIDAKQDLSIHIRPSVSRTSGWREVKYRGRFRLRTAVFCSFTSWLVGPLDTKHSSGETASSRSGEIPPTP